MIRFMDRAFRQYPQEVLTTSSDVGTVHITAPSLLLCG